MCTGFVKKGKDLICGFNFDIDKGIWDYRIIKTKELFCIGIKVGSTTYKVHGVNSQGCFGNLPYMNAPDKGAFQRGKQCFRLDLLVNSYISGKLSYQQVVETVSTKSIVNIPNGSIHSLLSNGNGEILLVEPGLGHTKLTDSYAVISNFPLLEKPCDLSPVYYGLQRYENASKILQASDDSFSAQDGVRLLASVSQGEPWATRVSFVYSKNENAVYYFTDSNVKSIAKHVFG